MRSALTDKEDGRCLGSRQCRRGGGGGSVTRHSAQQVDPSLDWIQMLALLLTGHMGIFLDLSGPCLLLKGVISLLSSPDCCNDSESAQQMHAKNTRDTQRHVSSRVWEGTRRSALQTDTTAL